MKNKRLIAMLLTGCMLFGMLPTLAFAEESEVPQVTVETAVEEPSEAPAQLPEAAEVEEPTEEPAEAEEPQAPAVDEEPVEELVDEPAEEPNEGIMLLAEEDVEPLADGIDWTAAAITISTLDELKEFAEQVNGGKNFKGQTITLGADIDLSGENWTPIGSATNLFMGTFDGNNKTVSNLTVNGEGRKFQGFFGYILSPAVVKNLTVNNAFVMGQECVGALIGDAYTGTVENCHVTGNIQITGNYDVGGLTGYGYAKLTNCSVVGANGSTVTGVHLQEDLEGDNVGGLIGYFAEGETTMTNCSAQNLTVIGTRKVGGLVGSTHANRSFINCSVENVTVGTNATTNYVSSAKIRMTMGIGGLIGLFNGLSGGKMENCSVENITLTNENGVFAKMGYVSGGGRTSEEVNIPTMTVTNVTISGTNTGSNVTIHDPALSGNAVETADTVAQVDGQYFTTLQDAIDAAQDGDEIVLLADVTVNETYSSNASLEIRKALTIDGQSQFTITCAKKFGIRIFGGAEDQETMKVVLKNVTVTNANSAGRAVETRGGNVELVLDNATLTTTGGGNTQVFTVGDNRVNPTTVTIKNGSKLIASQAGYGITTFNPVNLTIDNSEVSGYGALYFKGPNSSAGSAGSIVNLVNGAKVSSTGIAGESNGFGTLVLQDKDITVNIKDSTVTAIADSSNNPATPQAAILFNSQHGTTTGETINISGNSYVNTVNEYAGFVRNYTSESTIAVSGGTFTCDVSDYCVEGFKTAYNETTGTYNFVEKTYVAQIGETKYETLQAAIAAAEDGDTVEIIKEGEYAPITVPAGVTVEAAENVAVTFKNTDGVRMMLGENAALKNVTVDNTENNDPNWIKTSAIGLVTYPGNKSYGFTLEGCTILGKGTEMAILHCNDKEATITNCTFKNFVRGYYACGDNNALGNVNITGNTFENVQIPVDGYWGKPATGKMTITGNTFTDGSYIQLWDYTQYLAWLSGNTENVQSAINAEIKDNTGDVTLMATHCNWFVTSQIETDENTKVVYTRLVELKDLPAGTTVTAVPKDELIGFENHTTSQVEGGKTYFYYLPEGEYTIQIGEVEYSCVISAPEAGQAYGETLTLTVEEDHTHDWGEGTVTVEATCAQEGEKLFTCACGSTKAETIEKTETHTFGAWVTDTNPQVGVAGSRHRDCTVCGHRETGTIPALPGSTNTGTGSGNYNPTPAPTPTPEPTPAPVEGEEEEDLEDPDTPLVIRPFLFEDVKESDWFHADVKTLFDKGLIDGVKETVFAPYMTSTRAMVATLLYRMAGAPSVEGLDVTVTDVEATAWYHDAVIWAYANGIFGGYQDGSFRGGEVITREQLAAVLSRYAIANGAKLTVTAGLESFGDADRVSPWAVENMRWAVSAGLIKGRGDQLAAQDTANRAELATLLVRLSALLEEQSETEAEPVG